MADLTKTEVKNIVRDEIQTAMRGELKKMVEDELKSFLKKGDFKNDIADISKEILKKLYKDLSLHHTYVIDRVKL
jgi:hypothetical protein